MGVLRRHINKSLRPNYMSPFGFLIPLTYYVDLLSSYLTLEQLSQLDCDQWLQLGVCLGVGNDQLETIRKSQHPTAAATLQPAKITNFDMQWKVIVEALESIGEYKTEYHRVYSVIPYTV